MMTDQTDNNRSADEIASDIERTRADLSSTVEAIQTKLTPGELKNQAVDYALSTTPGAFGANLVTTVRDNPIPVALIGVGIAWLMSVTKQSSQRAPYLRQHRLTGAAYPELEGVYDDNIGYASGASAHGSGEGMLQRAASKTSEAASDLKHRASDVGQRLSDTASEVSGQARQMGDRARGKLHETAEEARARMHELSQRSQVQYYRAKDRLDRLLDEQPIVIGALGIAVGAALGATLPATRRENELMGRTRDDLLQRAKETAREQAENVKHSAQRVVQTAKQEVNRVKDDVSSDMAPQDVDSTVSRAYSPGIADTTPFGTSNMPDQQRPH